MRDVREILICTTCNAKFEWIKRACPTCQLRHNGRCMPCLLKFRHDEKTDASVHVLEAAVGELTATPAAREAIARETKASATITAETKYVWTELGKSAALLFDQNDDKNEEAYGQLVMFIGDDPSTVVDICRGMRRSAKYIADQLEADPDSHPEYGHPTMVLHTYIADHATRLVAHCLKEKWLAVSE
jgi:hypothetical protein